MEEKILYKVLSNIGTGKEFDATPDIEYIKALESVGFIKMGWDNELTDFGKEMLTILQNRIKW